MPEVKKALKNCYFDTAAAPFLYEPGIYGQLQALICSRLIFGSDFPLITQERALNHLQGDSTASPDLALDGSRLFS
jgi:predicted TIM-barrel fold metal-dependent hydrolase